MIKRPEYYDEPEEVNSKENIAIKIGNKHGLMMHDPIQRYHIFNAMEEYASQFTQPTTDEGLLEALKEIKKRSSSPIIGKIATNALQKYESSKPRNLKTNQNEK